MTSVKTENKSCKAKEQIEVEIGSTISFGGYDWRVLDIQDGKALLLSDKAVKNRAYQQSSYRKTTWAECSLREYLNGKFYNSLGEDKARIAETVVTTSNNPWYSTNGGDDTNDKIFLLSIEEVVKYFGDSGQLKNRMDNAWCINDEYNSARIATDKKGTVSRWWLRSPGSNDHYAADVNDSGNLVFNGNFVDLSGGGVRPALWLNLQSEYQQEEPDTAMGNNSSNQDMQDDIKQWYATEYPDDETGDCLQEGNSFRDLFHVLVVSIETYEFLGCADSMIRERIFSELSSRMGVGYEDIYALWTNR